MEIFVQSRGFSSEFDYCWQPKVAPFLDRIASLIQDDYPSTVLARIDSKLILLATGLSSPEKKDFRDRTIQHSLMWVLDDDLDADQQIRAIAIEALREKLADRVDKYIHLGGEAGFSFSEAEIKNMSSSLLDQNPVGSDPPRELTTKIAKTSRELREDIAEKLQHYSLPKSYEFVVIVTGIKAEKALEKAGAWRSLSSLVKSNDWRDLVTSSDIGEDTSRNFRRAVVIILLVITAILVLLLILNLLT